MINKKRLCFAFLLKDYVRKQSDELSTLFADFARDHFGALHGKILNRAYPSNGLFNLFTTFKQPESAQEALELFKATPALWASEVRWAGFTCISADYVPLNRSVCVADLPFMGRNQLPDDLFHLFNSFCQDPAKKVASYLNEKGVMFLHYEKPEHALAAVERIDGLVFNKLIKDRPMFADFALDEQTEESIAADAAAAAGAKKRPTRRSRRGGVGRARKNNSSSAAPPAPPVAAPAPPRSEVKIKLHTWKKPEPAPFDQHQQQNMFSFTPTLAPPPGLIHPVTAATWVDQPMQFGAMPPPAQQQPPPAPMMMMIQSPMAVPSFGFSFPLAKSHSTAPVSPKATPMVTAAVAKLSPHDGVEDVVKWIYAQGLTLFSNNMLIHLVREGFVDGKAFMRIKSVDDLQHTLRINLISCDYLALREVWDERFAQ